MTCKCFQVDGGPLNLQGRPADVSGMIDLFTVKRVLAPDLGMNPRAIVAHLDELGLPVTAGSDSAEISLAQALQIVAVAESRARASV